MRHIIRIGVNVDELGKEQTISMMLVLTTSQMRMIDKQMDLTKDSSVSGNR